MNIDEQNNHLNSPHSTKNKNKNISAKVNETVEMSTDEVTALLDFWNGKISFHELLNVSENGFRSCILNYINTHSPLTQWQEWEIYKIQWKNKEYIIAKKRFDTKSKHESKMQELFHKASEKSKSWVKIPELIHEFEDDKNGYLVMEYIPWKTLYTMIWQEIAQSHLIPEIKRHFQNNNINNTILFNDIELFLKKYDWWCEFSDDAQTINEMQSICGFLYELGIIKWNFDYEEINPNNKSERKRVIEIELLDKFSPKINIFNKDQKNKILSQLKLFLSELHSDGLYHRDLWKNLRNIMFTQIDNNNYDIHLIDFWRSIQLDNNNWSYDYENYYTRDDDILRRIEQTLSEKSISDNNDNELALKILQQNWLELDISLRDIEYSKKFIKNKKISSIYDDLISKKQHSYYYQWTISMKKNMNNEEARKNKLGRSRIYTLLAFAELDDITNLTVKINQSLGKNKSTNEYKFAVMFKSYLDDLRS